MCLTTATLHAGGDVIAQKFIEKKEQLELIRTGRFFLIGLVWDGPLLSWWYRTLSRALPSASKPTTILKVALDQGVFIPGMLASFLVLNGALQRMDGQDIKNILQRDYFQLLLANYQLWPLAMAFNFYLMPLRHQVLFTNSVSLAWNTYLSWKANKKLNPELTANQMQTYQSAEKECAEEVKEDEKFSLLPDVNNNCNKVNNNCAKLENSSASVDQCGKLRQAPAKEMSLFTRGWSIDYLSHPYALLPR